jgi:hypothetical protein
MYINDLTVFVQCSIHSTKNNNDSGFGAYMNLCKQIHLCFFYVCIASIYGSDKIHIIGDIEINKCNE